MDGEGCEAGVPVEPMPIYAFADGHGSGVRKGRIGRTEVGKKKGKNVGIRG